MRHKWDYSRFGSEPRDMLCHGRRVCTVCECVQRRFQDQSWQRVVGYHWGGDGREPCPGKPPPKLKWKAASHAHQRTHCKRYWVERDPDGGHFNRWHAHRDDCDEQLTMDGFDTREEAKAYCQRDADDKFREAHRPKAHRWSGAGYVCADCGAIKDTSTDTSVCPGSLKTKRKR